MKTLLALFVSCALASAASAAAGRFGHLESNDPFYPQLSLAKFTTPQWIGKDGVDAVVIISIDDLREPAKYEGYLRPILERLKQIDGRAPVSIFCNELAPDHPQFPTWLQEGVSLEVHTLAHPCPLLGKNGFAAAAQTFHGGIDLLAKIPGNTPVAFRMPCCDSMNSASPRFFHEILNQPSAEGRRLAIDTSVMCLLTPRDPSLPRTLTVQQDGTERFRKYFPMELVPPRKLTFERFAGYIEDYPYPYVVGRGAWEFPCIAPSDWEAFNLQGANHAQTTEDWMAALDAVVLKQGVMTMVLHPHGWSAPAQIIALIDHAVATYGQRVKFLTFPEALARLEKHALGGQALRAADDRTPIARLLDLNGDGFMDVVGGNPDARATRLWRPEERRWQDVKTPFSAGVQAHFGMLDGAVVMLTDTGPAAVAARFFEGQWQLAPELLAGLPSTDARVQLRDFTGDDRDELLLSTPGQTRVFHRPGKQWEPAPFELPRGVSLLDGKGRDSGLRFVDLNGDDFEDLLLSSETHVGIWLWNKTVRADLGWGSGWSQIVRDEVRTGSPQEPPPFVRAGTNNGAWFKDGHLVVQNEDTAKLEGVVWRESFRELIAFDLPPPKSPAESLACLQPRPGFIAQLVAAEPLVVDPVAFEWGADGRLWVVEMRDYPLGLDGKGAPGGVVKVLDDDDGDGVYDRATVFLEGLAFPTGIMPWRKGALVAVAPDILYAEDADGDGRAEIQRVLFSGFRPGNQQHRMNGFEWGLDGWIYGANGDSGGSVQAVATTSAASPRAIPPQAISGRDFRFRPDTGAFEPASGATQFGRRRDDWGQWFGNNNATWLWQYPLPEHYLQRNPKLAVKTTRRLLAQYPEASRVHAISTQPIRFNQPQSLGHVTSACSPSPYRDALFGPDFATSIFISEPVHNAVHREVLLPDGTSRRAADEGEREFLASSDVWFRPAMVKTGPDGALYIADMYRFVLEHPEWIAPETQARLDLRAGQDKGRIYRVFPKDQPPRSVPDLASRTSEQLVEALDHPSGWQRDTAQRLLFERGDLGDRAPLERLALSAANPKVRVQALATLDVLDASRREVLRPALRDAHPQVVAQALRGAEKFLGTPGHGLFESLEALRSTSDRAVQLQLAFTLGASREPQANALLQDLASRSASDEFLRAAVLSSVAPDSPLMKVQHEKSGKPPVFSPSSNLPETAVPGKTRAEVVQTYGGFAALKSDAKRGATIYRQTCSTCHRFKGEGHELGPDLASIAGKADEWLLTAIFDPNQAIEARYQMQSARLKNGTELLGLIITETGNSITLRTADGMEHAVLRGDLQGLQPLGRSLMPEGLEAVLSLQNVADLAAFLRGQ